MTNTAQITESAAIAAFVLAGNATFTLVSEQTGARFTYRVRAGKGDGAPLFVHLLTGPDNARDYTYLGCVWVGGSSPRYVHGKRSPVSTSAPGAKGFAWFARQVFGRGVLEGAAFHHEGRCCRCGRLLTVPESVVSGWGPECAKKAA